GGSGARGSIPAASQPRPDALATAQQCEPVATKAALSQHVWRGSCFALYRGGVRMPEQETLERARQDAAEGKAPSTQAGEFVKEEMDHIREGKHGARSTKQAIAIGLSKARRAGVPLPPPSGGKSATRRKAAQDYQKGRT